MARMNILFNALPGPFSNHASPCASKCRQPTDRRDEWIFLPLLLPTAAASTEWTSFGPALHARRLFGHLDDDYVSVWYMTKIWRLVMKWLVHTVNAENKTEHEQIVT
jgi:hypothetical protein